jgi:threonylcarbamoyladenosine tRNA methylthiotransferase MtaB
MERKRTAVLYTLGCRLNQAETAIIARSLEQAGYQLVSPDISADLSVINTCTVTEQADAKCRQLVRKVLRNNPRTYVAVVGCYAQMAPDMIKSIKGIDLIIGNAHKLQITDYLNGLEKRKQPAIVYTKKLSRGAFQIGNSGLYENSTRANLKIQDGCNFVCSYCIIPKARGTARSRVFDDILKEAYLLVEHGHQELVITGINVGNYSYGGKTILDVLQALETIDGLARIRISSIEPTTIADALIYHIAESEKACKHLHMPMQSGDNRILELMRRKYTAGEFADFVEFVHKTVPDVALGTDVMVGFPSETWASFTNTKKVLADLPIAYYHVFTYSARTGTTAAKMAENVPVALKKEWSRIIIEQGQRKRHAFYDAYLNSELEVLFEQNRAKNWTGYTSNYMQVALPANENLHNRIRRVKLMAITDGILTAAPVS